MTRLSDRLLDWQVSNRRLFPWRRDLRTAWQVLLSELLLRQTDAKRVAPVYDRLLMIAPRPHDLANLTPAELEEVLQPIGLHRQRARGLIELGLALRESGGELPSTEADLRELPHVGPYAAGAVSVFALGLCAPLPDINIGRVGGRYFGMPFRKRSEISAVAKRVARHCPAQKAREFYWAVLDISAAICRPANPRCSECPLAAQCHFGRSRLAELRRQSRGPRRDRQEFVNH